MKRFALLLLIVALPCFPQSKPAAKDDPLPVLTDAQHAAIRDTELTLVQAQAQLVQIQQQYASVQKTLQDAQAKLQEELKSYEKDGYVLDPQSLKYSKAPAPTAPHPSQK